MTNLKIWMLRVVYTVLSFLGFFCGIWRLTEGKAMNATIDLTLGFWFGLTFLHYLWTPTHPTGPETEND